MDTNDTPEPHDDPTLPLETLQTETQPVETSPMDAKPKESFAVIRRHPIGIAITAAVLAVIVVAGGTAWGVSAAIASAQTTASAPMTAMNAAHSPTKSGKGAKKTKRGASGTIATMSGDTWTLHTASGATVTVTLSSSTAFGTKKSPSTETSFAVGDKVGAAGTRSGDTVTATRIVHLPLRQPSSTPSPAPTSGT